MPKPLSTTQEAQAQQLAGEMAAAIQDDLLEMARTLQGSDPASLFGQTEFALRDLAHRIAAKLYERHLGGKKTATLAPA